MTTEGGTNGTSWLAPALRIWSAAYLVFVAGFSIWSCYVLIDARYTTAHLDDWRILDDFFSNPFLEWLFAGQNGHRVPLTLLLFAIDYTWLDGDQLLLVLATVASAAAAVSILYRAFRLCCDTGSSVSRLSFGFAWFCVFWAGTSYYFLWGVSHGNLMVVLWLFMSLFALVKNEAHRETDASYGSTQLLFAAGVAALLATFSFGTGFAVWLALLACAVLARYPWKGLAALGFAAVASLAGYSTGLERGPVVSYDALLTAVLERPADVARYALSFIGSAAGLTARGLGWINQRGVAVVGLVAGSIGVATALAYGLWIRWRPLRASPLELLSLGTMASAAGSAALVAFGRAWLGGTSQVHPRFVLWSVLFWVGAAIALASAGRARTRGTRARQIAAALLPVVSVCMLPGMQNLRSLELARTRVVEHLSLALMLGIESESISEKIFGPKSGEAELVDRVAERLRRDRRNLFADVRADLFGASLESRFAVSPADLCKGTRTARLRVPTEGAPARDIRGVAWRSDAMVPFDYIVVTDATGVIRGLGSIREVHRPPDAPLQSVYSGYVAGFDPSAFYSAWGVFASATSACLLQPTLLQRS